MQDTTALIPQEPPFRWEALLDSARTFAQASVANYSVQDAAFFFLHAGASVELAIKAALCRVNPVLLLEGGGRFTDQALIRLAGYAPTLPGKKLHLFTVGFDQAVHRFKILHGSDALGVEEEDIQALKSARDVTAHGGNVTEAASETLLRTLVTLGKVHGTLAPLLDTTPEEFWGASYGLVEKASRQQKDQTQHQVQTLLTAANTRFQEQYGDVNPDALGEILQRASERLQPQLGATIGYRTCPVCSASGLSRERPAKRSIVRRGRPAVERGWIATDFRCSVCKLTLPSEELVQAASGFDPWFIAEEDLLDLWAEDSITELDEDDREVLEALGFEPGYFDYLTQRQPAEFEE